MILMKKRIINVILRKYIENQDKKDCSWSGSNVFDMHNLDTMLMFLL